MIKKKYIAQFYRLLNYSNFQVSVWDSEPGLSNHNLIGDTEIDIKKIAPNKPFK